MKERKLFRSIICLLGVAITVILFTACAGESNTDVAPTADRFEDRLEYASVEKEDAADDWTEWEADELDEAPAVEMPRTRIASDMVIEDEEGALGSMPILLPAESGRQLAYTVHFDIETLEFRSGMRLLFDTVASMDGYTERWRENGRSMRQPNLERNASFRFRIPNEQLPNFIEFIEVNYNIVFAEGDLIDFTFTYERNEANLETLREQEQRILDELESDSYEEPDVTEDDLADVRDRIRNLEESNTTIQRDVDYSDVTIRLSEIIMPEEEIEEEPETFGDRLQTTIDNSLDNLLVIAQVVLLISITMLPWLLFVAVIVAPIVYLIKRHKRKKRSNESHQNEVIE